jgi:hypothetical protein
VNCNKILRTQESQETRRTIFRKLVLCLLYCSCLALLCEICSNRVVLCGIKICILGRSLCSELGCKNIFESLTLCNNASKLKINFLGIYCRNTESVLPVNPICGNCSIENSPCTKLIDSKHKKDQCY